MNYKDNENSGKGVSGGEKKEPSPSPFEYLRVHQASVEDLATLR